MTVTETLYISSSNRTDKENDEINNFSIKLNKTYRNVKSVKLKKITVMNSWYNVRIDTKKIVFNLSAPLELNVNVNVAPGYYSIPSLCQSIIDIANQAPALTDNGLELSYDFDYLVSTSKILFRLNTANEFKIDLLSTTIDKRLLGVFDTNTEAISAISPINGLSYIISSGIASVYTDDFVFMKIDEFDDKVTVANKIDKYTFVIQNSTDKLDNIVIYDEQKTTASKEFNSLRISLYNEKNQPLKIFNDYSFLLEIEYCNR